MENPLTIYCDGGARGNPGPAAAAFIVFSQGHEIKREAYYLGEATNNMAEYQAVFRAINWLKENKDKSVLTFVLDSQLVVRQLSGQYKIKAEHLKEVVFKIKTLEKLFPRVVYTLVTRQKNKMADKLVNEKLDSISRPRLAF